MSEHIKTTKRYKSILLKVFFYQSFVLENPTRYQRVKKAKQERVAL